MLNKLHNSWRPLVIFILFVAMLLSLFVSRAALSVSMGLFLTVSLLHTNIKKQVAFFFSSPLLWGMSLLFLLPLISGWWSEDADKWQEIVQIKLPLALLPLAFAGPVYLSLKMWDWLAYIFITLILAASIWSMLQYINSMAVVHAAYLQAKTMITPLRNDHVRFSWLVSVAVLLSVWLFMNKRKQEKTVSIILVVIAGWLIIFLHILAARTGLFSFYIMLLMFAIWLIVMKLKWQYGLSLLVLLVALPIMAWVALPTFQNRVRYIRYDFVYFKEANYLPGANDAMRVISLKAGWSLLTQHPVAGVGFGDVLRETNAWYQATYPQMIETDKINPSSEWLMYGAGCGWLGFLLFSFVMLVPFFIGVQHKLLWCMLHGSAAFSFIFDIGLEVQYGVFSYAFIVLWWWKWLKR
ncbi:MAG: O-antigen ligase family protein [Chitinophagaceae bacterium]|nr:O-antigen ligase family protein [Chitinophagaceae bacterium]